MADSGTNYFSSNPWLSTLLTGVGGAAGAMPTNSTINSSGSGTSNTSSSQTSDALSQLLQTINQQQTQTTQQTLSPEAQGFLDNLMTQYNDLATKGVDLSGYRGSGLGVINQAFNNATTGTNEDLAARGLSTSPVAASITAGQNNARIGQQAQFINSLPLLSNQIKTQNLANAANFMNVIPRGTTSFGSTTGTTSQTGSQSQNISGTSNTATTNNQTQKTSSGGGWGGLLSGLAGTALKLAGISDKRLKENIEDDNTAGDMALKAVMKLKPKTFNFIGEGVTPGHHGFVAQDVEKVMPHAVKEIGGIKHLDHGAMMSTIVKALQHVHSLKNEKDEELKKAA